MFVGLLGFALLVAVLAGGGTSGATSGWAVRAAGRSRCRGDKLARAPDNEGSAMPSKVRSRKPSKDALKQLSGSAVHVVKPGDVPTVNWAHLVLGGKGRRGFLPRLLPFLGPAFVACVAYIDPGNFATTLQGGAAFGYMLLWVIVTSNLM